MEYEEVIEILDSLHQRVCLDELGETERCEKRNEALDVAIMQVRKGIPAKRIAKEVVKCKGMGDPYEYTTIEEFCPTCGITQHWKYPYCIFCGQKLE